jgi:hypothetical protein
MIFNGVRLPDEVSIALEEGRLVVFAGAGISVPPPSNLPLFNGLASQIWSGNPVEPRHEDRLLGRLARDGTDVHAAAARILYHEGTQPTKLHGEILRLFGTPERVRVVTTNFDDHFSAAGRKIFGKDLLREFYAPALPLGDDFEGLVYIHGSARFNPRTLILTDKDFGAAYLTRGWARDFLVPLFSKYTVLFIGYSHSDVTTTYLARGLNQAEIKPRWTMVPSDIEPQGRDDWAHLEISVAEYPIDPANTLNRHQALTDFFAQWADHTREPIFARSKRVRTIARGLPPESATVSEYISYCLNHPRLAQDFCAGIRHPAWVGWMHDHGYFKPFFENTTASSESHGSPQWVLAHWLCSYVRRRHPDRLLDLVQMHQRLSRGFTQILAQALWVEHSKKADRRFPVWISILLSQDRDAVREDIWAYLLTECHLPEHLGVALRIFELLTTPEIRVDKSWDFSSFTSDANDASKPAKRKVDYSIQWPGESRHWLSKAWIDIFKPHLPEIAESLVQVIIKQLTHAYLLLHGVGRASDRYDRLSCGRSSIAPHGQDDLQLQECFSCLVDILREIILHWIATDPQRARMQAKVFWSTKLPLFKRFAAYALAVDPQYGADERIDWVVVHDLIFRSGMKKEVFDILATAYPNASLASRRRLLRRIDRGDRTSGYKKLEPRTLAYEKFNILAWLRRSDAQCNLIQAAIAKIHALHPEFVERDYPEFDAWHGGAQFIDPNEGVDFDRILSESPERYLSSIRKVSGDSAPPDRRDCFSNLSELFSKNQKWGRQFTEILAQEPDADAQIWSDVFSAWREKIKTGDDWNWILTVIGKLPHEKAIYASVANLISHGIWKEQAGLNEATIDRAASIMDRAWTLCSIDDETPDESYRDWLTSAINHVGGWIGEFWVHYCSNLRHRPEANWNGIPDPLRSKMLEAINGKSRVTVYARLALTPWIGFLFLWDREFAVAHLLPLLDWQRDPIVAQQTWSVLLNYNRGRFREFEIGLMPYYRQLADTGMTMLKGATEKSEQFDAQALRSLGHSLAGLAMHVIPDPVDSGFFRDFLPLLPDEVRSALADGMQRYLKGMDNRRREELWEVWLERYIDLRLIGVPVALSLSETKHMLEWCLHLGPVFPRAVDRIAKMPRKGVFAYGLIDELLKSDALDKFPIHACRLAIAALQAEDYPSLHESLLTLHKKLKSTINGTNELTSFEELLYLRGWQRR